MSKNVNVVMSVVDKFSKPFNEMGGKVEGLGRRLKRNENMYKSWGNKVERTFDSVVKKGSIALGALGTIQLKRAFDDAVELSDGVAHAFSLMDNMIKPQVEKSAVNIAKMFHVSYTEATDAMFSAKSASVAEHLIEDVVMLSGKLAKTTKSNTDDTTKLLSQVGNAFDLKTLEDYQRGADIIAFTQKRGVIEMDEMVKQYGRALPAVQMLGFSFEEFSGMVAKLTKDSSTPTQALTGIVGILRGLTGSSSDARKELLSLGIDLEKIMSSDGGFENLINKIGGLSDDQFKDVFSRFTGWQSAKMLFDDDNIDDLMSMIEDFKTISGGTLDDRFAKATNSLGWKYENVKESIRGIQQQVTSRLAPEGIRTLDKLHEWLETNSTKIIDTILNVIGKVKDLATGIKDFVSNNKEVVKMVATLFGVWIVFRKISGVFKSVRNGFKIIIGFMSSLSPLKIIFVGIGIVIADVVRKAITNWEHFQERFGHVIDFINRMKERLGDIFGGILELVSNVTDKMIGSFDNSNSLIGTSVELIANLIESIAIVVEGVLDVLNGLLTGDWTRVWDGFAGIVEGVARIIENIVAGMINVIITAINFIIRQINKFTGWINGTWVGKKIGTIGGMGELDLVEYNRDSKNPQGYSPTDSKPIPVLAKGTKHWGGGIAQINEKGGEIVDMPKGTRVYPHDISKEMAKANGGVSVYLNVEGNMVGDKEFGEQVGNVIVQGIKGNRALA